MRNVLTAAFALILALPCAVTASTATPKMPKCSGRVVWAIPTHKVYVLSTNPAYGKKPGDYECETHAIAHGYHMRPLNIVATNKPKQIVANAATPSPSPIPAPSMAIPENSSVTALARAQIDILKSGKLNRAQYGDQLNTVLTDNVVSHLQHNMLSAGNVTSFSYAGTTNLNGLPVAVYAVSFERAMGPTNQWVESIAADPTGKVIFLAFQPKT